MIDLAERVRELEAALGERDAQLAEAQERIARLERQVEKRLASLGRNSSNSSKPPSTDRGRNANRNATKGKGSKRKRGAKKGHRGSHRTLLPPERVDETVVLRPCRCGHCGRGLSKEAAGDPERHQGVELPEVRAHVTEYQLYAARCRCGRTTRAPLPEGVSRRPFGPKLVALVALLVGHYRLSRRRCVDFLSTIVGVEISLGGLSRLEQEVSAALEPAHAEALTAAQQQAVGYADETRWQQCNKTHWIWVLVTSVATVFLIRPHRDTKTAKELLGDFDGTLVADRMASYSFWAGKRQVCWAHLLRLFVAFSEAREGTFKHTVGTKLLNAGHDLFHEWHRFVDGEITRATLKRRTLPIRRAVFAALREGRDGIDAELKSKCQSLLMVQKALFTFLFVEDVEPTNNGAERALRHGVILRKLTFGSQSDRGSRFLERIFTAIETLRARGGDIFGFLHETVLAHRFANPTPSLLAA